MKNDLRGSESDVGELHGQITKLCNLSASNMIERAEACEDPSEIPLILDTRDIGNLMKWVQHNRISCPTAIDDGDTELSKQIKDIQDKAYSAHKGRGDNKMADVISMFEEEERDAPRRTVTEAAAAR